jgi:transposase
MRENSIYWVGMDVHADNIRVAVYRGNEAETQEEYDNRTDKRSKERLLKRLKGLPGEVRSVYEAGPCGYELQRYLTSAGIKCEIAAPALIPKRAGERIETDKRDARNLGRLYRAGELTVICIPDEEQEAVRDLVRAREDAVEDVRRKRHQLSKFLLRHGHRYHDGEQWTQGHSRWMSGIEFENEALKAVYEEYTVALNQVEERVERLTRAIQEIAQTAKYQKPVEALMTLRGVKIITAMTIMTEMGDILVS